MDPFDPFTYFSETNLLVQVLAALLPVFLLAFVVLVGRRFLNDCKEVGAFNSAASWGWELAFFPVIIFVAMYLGWWAIGLALLWPFGSAFARSLRRTDETKR